MEQGRRDRGEQGRERNGHRAQGTGRGERSTATTRRSSTASGCARRTCTTARCRRLRDLLEPVEKRPKVFWRGYDLYDQVKVGFVTSPDEAELVGMRCEAVQAKKLCEVERVGTPYDVNQRGSGNQGHVYGTDLATKDKEALVEYLKTL